MLLSSKPRACEYIRIISENWYEVNRFLKVLTRTIAHCLAVSKDESSRRPIGIGEPAKGTRRDVR